MREILFRGKRVDNGEWAEGYLFAFGAHAFIVNQKEFVAFESSASFPIVCELRTFGSRVIPETVGQYTGLTDRNGVRIFEGDICKAYKKVQAYKDFEFKGVVQYSIEIGAFELVLTPFDSPMLCDFPDCEVIGNIHDKELLKAED